MYLDKKTLCEFLKILPNGRMYDVHETTDVWRTKEVPVGLEGVNLKSAGWVMLTGNQPKGEIIFKDDDILGPFTFTNLIDAGNWTFANGAPVPDDIVHYLREVNSIEDTAFIFDEDASNRPKSNQRLPVGVTVLPNGKFRFKRKTKRKSVDFTTDSYEEVFKAAKEFEDEISKVSEIVQASLQEDKSLRESGIDTSNIYKRGRQYFVEFMINKKRICILKTYDFNEAVSARDRFVRERRNARATAKQQERMIELKAYEKMLEEGLLNLDYGSLKIALNFLTKEEFDSVVENYNPATKVI